MSLPQWIYKTFYHPQLNILFRNLNRVGATFLPENLKLAPSGKISIRTSSGKKIILTTNQTNYVARLIYWKGYQAFEYTPLFLKLIQKLEVFFDVGANIGYYSLLAASEKPEIQVTAFEPAVGPLHYLKENVRLNHLRNIRIESIALSDREGSITFFEHKNRKYPYLDYNLSGENNAGTKTENSIYVSRDVPSITLDQYVRSNNIDHIDLIKLDTEGTEASILKYASETLEKLKPTIICETLFNSGEEELEAIFRSHNYQMYKIKGPKLERVETLKRSVDDGVRDCLFVHPDRLNDLNDILVD